MAIAATVTESPTPFLAYRRPGSRLSMADTGSYGYNGPVSYSRRPTSRQSLSRTQGNQEQSLLQLRRSLSRTRESPPQSNRNHHSASRPLSAMATSYAASHRPDNRSAGTAKQQVLHDHESQAYINKNESSDDDVPEPIKFSESVEALLGEDGTPNGARWRSPPGIGMNSESVARDNKARRHALKQNEGIDRTSHSPEARAGLTNGTTTSQSRPVRQVRIASPRRLSTSAKITSPLDRVDINAYGNSEMSQSPRLVKVSGRSPSSLSNRRSPSHTASDRSVRTQRTGSDASDHTNTRAQHYSLEDHEHKDFVTPAHAGYKRAVCVNGTNRSPPSADHAYERRASLVNDSRLEEDPLRDRGYNHEHEFSAWPVSTLRTRTALMGNAVYGGEEVGMSSMRVKRLGKLRGSFLNGPARRGVLRRQSEEERQSDQEQDESFNGEEGKGEAPPASVHETPTPSPRDRRADWDAKEDSPPLDGHHVSKSRAGWVPDQPTTPPAASPPPPHAPYPLQEKREFKVIYEVPVTTRQTSQTAAQRAQMPDVHASHDENESPALLRRKMQLASDLQKGVKSINHDANSKQSQLQQHSDQAAAQVHNTPRRQPLGPKSTNAPTPVRAAPPPPQASARELSTVGNAGTQNRKKRVQVVVNQKPYTRLDCIGRGGSGRVYRVMAENCKIFALKRVNLANVDPIALQGYKGEISLLKRLEDVERVVRLYDFELNKEKQVLSVLMEFGESDLHNILAARLNAENALFDPSFTRFYWKEMLECVRSVHALNIVHSDLKPANFVLVRGKLKLIDFGIADAIQENTVNVHRETQIGTPNYMAPEALIDTNAGLNTGKMMKLGKPSDVWSLGCILYQMTYGRQPFAHIQNQLQRIMAISNPDVEIQFPQRTTIGDVQVPQGLLTVLRRCLTRDQRKRPSIEELLSGSDPFLHPEVLCEASASGVTLPEGTVPMTQEMLARILNNVVHHCRSRGVPKDEDIKGWPAGFMRKIRGAMEAETRR